MRGRGRRSEPPTRGEIEERSLSHSSALPFEQHSHLIDVSIMLSSTRVHCQPTWQEGRRRIRAGRVMADGITTLAIVTWRLLKCGAARSRLASSGSGEGVFGAKSAQPSGEPDPHITPLIALRLGSRGRLRGSSVSCCLVPGT
jgi:hypothetical protein